MEKELQDKIVELYNEGVLKRHIRDQLGVTGYTVNMALIKVPGAVPIPEKNICESIVSDYQNGMKYQAITKKYKIDSSIINKVFLEYGIEKQRKTKYDVDHFFFDKIDTEEKAYWFGFLMADGYNNQKMSNVEIGLKDSEKEHLEMFLSHLKSNLPIKHRVIKGSGTIRLTICSKRISDKLAEKGCIQNKSLVLEFPEVQPELMNHFIRGYFDGDGSVSINKKKGMYKFHLIGTESFLEQARIEMDMHQVKKYQKGQAFDLAYGGRLNLKKLYSYLYKDATVYLPRKKEVFQQCLEQSI